MACCRCRPRGQQGRGTVGDRQPVRRCLGLVRSQAAGLRTTSLSRARKVSGGGDSVTVLK